MDVIQNNQFRLGFTNVATEQTGAILNIQGSLPEWASGSLFYNGPAKFTIGKSSVTHWLDGLSMLHRFVFINNSITYRSKFLHSEAYTNAITKNSMFYPGFAQDPHCAFFKRIISLFIPTRKARKTIQNSNVSIGKIGNYYAAIADKPLPVTINPETLETGNLIDFDEDTIDITQCYENPHPYYDADRNETISFVAAYGATNHYHIYRIAHESNKREIITSIPVEYLSYMHSFSVTDQYIILIEYPFLANPANLILKSKPFIENFIWKPQQGTRFLLIDRKNGAVIDQFYTTAFFALHQVNAFEKKRSLMIDLVSYSDPSIINNFYFENMAELGNEPTCGQLTRYILDFTTKMVWSEIITTEYIEYPAINPQFKAKDYTYVYGAEFNPAIKKRNYNYLIKINNQKYTVLRWFQPGCYPSEPTFIANPHASSEDDGIIVSCILDTIKKKSFLLFLDAKTFKEVARASLPNHIPFGIHGFFEPLQ